MAGGQPAEGAAASLCRDWKRHQLASCPTHAANALQEREEERQLAQRYAAEATQEQELRKQRKAVLKAQQRSDLEQRKQAVGSFRPLEASG